MLRWLRNLFSRSQGEQRRRFFAMVDDLNASSHGGRPTIVDRRLGHLDVHSGAILLGDPQDVTAIEVPWISAGKVAVDATLWSYPAGGSAIVAIKLSMGDAGAMDERRKVGTLGIDSAKVIIADEADIHEHWTERGKDRIGSILVARDHTVRKLLTARFKLKTVPISPVRVEILGPVSEELEHEIYEYLKTFPQYAKMPFIHFRVDTNNSFERALYMHASWGFIPVGNQPLPLMFVCETGRGDGAYDVFCDFCEGSPRVISIRFIEEGEDSL